jgi:predicted PilT family ATPase
LDLYVPESYKGRIIGKAGANVNQLEKDMGLKINLRSFDELPLLDVKTKINTPKKNARTDISFPAEFAEQNICFLV